MALQNDGDDSCIDTLYDFENNTHLPIEVIIHIMSYLTVSDRISAGLVCRQWYEASLSSEFIDKQLVIVSRGPDNLQRFMNALLVGQRQYYHIKFKQIEVKRNLPIWDRYGSILRSLTLVDCDLSERTLVSILKECKKLRALHIISCRECLMSGRLLDNKNDVKELSTNFQSVTELSLAANRYLSDALFNRLVSICPNLESLHLTDCQISFHSGVYKRFYPDNRTWDEASESLLTFFNVLMYIQKQATKLKELCFGSTLLDSTALGRLSTVEGLKLKSLKLKSCVQISNLGFQSLIHQPTLCELDITSCSRVTDASLICICENLLNIEKLIVRRLRLITDHGVSKLRALRKLKELDISECDQLTGNCIRGFCCPPEENEDKSSDLNDTQDEENINPNFSTLETKNSSEIYQNYFLESLTVKSLNLDENSIECIANSFPKLKYLDVGCCFSAVSDKSVQKIFKGNTQLETLILMQCRTVSDAGLTGMGAENRTNLGDVLEEKSQVMESKLRIKLGSKAEIEIVRDAKRKKDVMKMCEDPSSPLDSDNFPGFSLLRLQRLRILDLMACNRVTDVSLKHAFKFRELRVLDISYCQQITHVGLDYLTRNNPAIERLNLSECHNITDLGIFYVAQRLHRLKYLYTRVCSKLTDESLLSIKEYAKNLQYLDVTSCQGITSKVVEGLAPLHVVFSE